MMTNQEIMFFWLIMLVQAEGANVILGVGQVGRLYLESICKQGRERLV